MNDELSRRREECLIRLVQHKEDIKRVAQTGIPLLHLGTDLVSMCLHFVLAELAMMPPPLEYSMNDDELARRRIECLIRLGQHKEAIKRISKTGIPLLHLDTELVSMCLHFVLAELAMMLPPLPTVPPLSPTPPPDIQDDWEGVATQMQYDKGDSKLPTYCEEPQPNQWTSGQYDYGDSYEPQGITSIMNYDDGSYKPTHYDDGPQGITSPVKYDNGDYKPICYDDGPQYITSPVKYDDGKSKEE